MTGTITYQRVYAMVDGNEGPVQPSLLIHAHVRQERLRNSHRP